MNIECWNQKNDSVDSPPAILVKDIFQNHWIIAAVIFWPTDLFGVLIPPFFYLEWSPGSWTEQNKRDVFLF